MAEREPVDVLSPVEMARRLGVHRETVYRWLDSGYIPGARKVGGLWFVSERRFTEWLDSKDEADGRIGLDLPAQGGQPLGGGHQSRSA